jgi:hypothetical protein
LLVRVEAGQALRYRQEMYAMSELLSSLANGLFYALGMVLIMHGSGIASKQNDQARRGGLRLLALYDSIRRWWLSFDHLANLQVLEQLHDQIGEAAFQAVWAEGQAMTKEEGVAYAGSLLEKYTRKEGHINQEGEIISHKLHPPFSYLSTLISRNNRKNEAGWCSETVTDGVFFFNFNFLIIEFGNLSSSHLYILQN